MKANPDFKKISDALKKTYSDAHCALNFSSPWQLLVATILSAQCTDVRVNMVTPVLFKKYPTPKALATAPLEDVEDIVRTTGFFRQKAKSIVMASRLLVERHDGRVPKTLEELIQLPGVARKTANVVLGSAYGIPSGVVVDTHVRRVSGRLGLTAHTDPVKIEKDLAALLPKKDWIWAAHALISHGRKVCKALSPLCPQCPVNRWCEYFQGANPKSKTRSSNQTPSPKNRNRRNSGLPFGA
ncbi:MAG: endonuclease III [Elusimicrobiota bacterium]